MSNFLRSIVLGVLPSLLRLFASAVEGYLEGTYGVSSVQKGDED